MDKILCVKCGNLSDGMQEQPYPGKLGERITNSVCRGCWAEWEEIQVKLVNEYRLQLYDRSHRDFLLTKMKEFLNLIP